MQALTPEAGDRRYFRPQNQSGWLHVTSKNPAPHATTDWLSKCGVRVPELGPNITGGYQVEDLGDVHLCHQPSIKNYRQLIELWRRFSFRELPAKHPNAQLALNSDLFSKELKQSHEFFFSKLDNGAIISAELMNQLMDELSDLASSGPWCLQHRDFHSRNVLITASNEIAIIDHQDLRNGPLFYDLASLWTDAYLDLPNEIRALLKGAIESFGSDFGLSGAALHEQFLFTSLQRVLKAVGTFAKLLAEGRNEYQEPLSRALQNVRTLLSQEEMATCGFRPTDKWHAHCQKWDRIFK